VNIFIDFGGFYETWHSEICERAIAYELGLIDDCGEIDDSQDKLFDFNQWGEIHAQYAEQWLDMFNNELDTNIKYLGLISPRFYNYQTDVIGADISSADCLKVMRFIRENDLKSELIRLIQNTVTHSSGYIPFYTWRDIFYRENRDILMRLAIEVIIESFNQNYIFALDEFYPDISEAAA